MGSGGLFGGLGQHSTGASQEQMHSQTAGLHVTHTLLSAITTARLLWFMPRPNGCACLPLIFYYGIILSAGYMCSRYATLS